MRPSHSSFHHTNKKQARNNNNGNKALFSFFLPLEKQDYRLPCKNAQTGMLPSEGLAWAPPPSEVRWVADRERSFSRLRRPPWWKALSRGTGRCCCILGPPAEDFGFLFNYPTLLLFVWDCPCCFCSGVLLFHCIHCILFIF